MDIPDMHPSTKPMERMTLHGPAHVEELNSGLILYAGGARFE
jgi:hypothetical protein